MVEVSGEKFEPRESFSSSGVMDLQINCVCWIFSNDALVECWQH